MRIGVVLCLSFCAGLSLSVGGCARTAEERQLDDLRSEITRIQEDRDRADSRLSVLEIEAADSKEAQVTRPAAAPPASPPPHPVALGASDAPPDLDEAADTEDASPRPTIRVLGTPGMGRSRWRGQDTIEDDGSSPSAPHSSALDPDAKAAYDAALGLVGAKKCDRALDALAAFLMKWPDHPYADNAMYWRGECYFARGEYVRAAEQFEGVLARFPAGNKAPDALLKLGITNMKLGNSTRAKDSFDQLARQYPQSDASRRIPNVTVPAATPPGPASEDRR